MRKITTYVSLLFVSITSISFAQWTLPTIPGGAGDLQSIDFASTSTAFATGYGGTLLKTTDEGLTWTSVSSPTTTDMYSVLFLDDNLGFLFGDLGRIYKTTDGGSTWLQKTSGTTNTLYSSAALSNNTTIFAVGDQIVLKSTDAGETWIVQTNPMGVEAARSIRFFNDNVGYIGGTNNGVSTLVYRTDNGGASWSSQTLPSSSDGDPVNVFGMSLVDANTVFACGGSKRIAKTTNGSTWSNINNATANFYRGCLFTSATEGYVVGGNGKIIKTVNASSFTSEVSGTTALLTAIVKNENGTILVTGGSGSGIIVRKAGAVANTPPVAVADASTTNQDTPVSTNVLANDSDPGGSLVPSSVTVTVPSSNGTTVVNTSTGAITFTPSAGFTGTTTYTYQVCDNGSPALCASAVVTITVNAVTSTISADDDTGTCIENDIDASIDILAGDLLNGQAATRFNVDVDVDLATAGIQNTFVSASPSATWTFDNVSFGMLGCNPGLDVEGTLTLSYVICDKANPTVCSNTATVTLTVTPSTLSLTENTLVFALFPNPATDLLTIHANSSAKSVKIISLEGKELINEVLVDANIAVASLANGLYQIEVRFEDGRVGRSSFMKN